MEIDGPTFVPKSGYFFLLIWVNVCLKKWPVLNFLANFVRWILDKMLALPELFQTRNPLLSLFLAFWLLYFYSFVQTIFERLLFHHI